MQFVLKGPDLIRVDALAEKLESRLRTIPEMGSPDLDLELAMPEVQLLPDRVMAEDLGLSTDDLADALRVLGGGLDVAKCDMVLASQFNSFVQPLIIMVARVQEALLEACPVRMRPVLMTSFTMILALLPASLGLGAGSDTNGPLAVAVIGGMVSSTFLTLVVVPELYSLVEQRKEWRTLRSAQASFPAQQTRL